MPVKVIPIRPETRPPAAALRGARFSAGLTQEQAAALAGVPLRTYRRWEANQSPLRQLEALLVLQALPAKVAA